MDVDAIQETQFVCNVDARVLSDDFVVYLAYGNRLAKGVPLLDKRSLEASLLLSIDTWSIILRVRCGREHLDKPSTQVASYLDRMLVRRADIDLLDCSTFHWLGFSDHRLVCVRVALDRRPRMVGYWKFSLSLLDRRDFQEP